MEGSIAREPYTMLRARQIAEDLKLDMKIGDVEFQGDGTKAIFYYIADERVDFRELIKVFAEQFKIRIEMKQIGARQEAGRIGGIGSCGRELCCSHLDYQFCFGYYCFGEGSGTFAKSSKTCWAMW
jgi:cell fate regulator YaaT (PSP1 superfamily)